VLYMIPTFGTRITLWVFAIVLGVFSVIGLILVQRGQK
jgi:preprotein translocase subunit SecG